MSDVWALCEETFGKVKAGWSQQLQELGGSYSPQELEIAFAEGKERGAKDLQYVVGILRNRREGQGNQRQKDAPIPSSTRLLCDRCENPTWINELTVIAGGIPSEVPWWNVEQNAARQAGYENGAYALCARCADYVRSDPYGPPGRTNPMPAAVKVHRFWEQQVA